MSFLNINKYTILRNNNIIKLYNQTFNYKITLLYVKCIYPNQI